MQQTELVSRPLYIPKSSCMPSTHFIQLPFDKAVLVYTILLSTVNLVVVDTQRRYDKIT